MLKGAIFDIDGTLLDSMFIWDTIGEDYLRTLGKEPHEDLREAFMPLTLEEAAEYYREHYGVTLSVNLGTAKKETYVFEDSLFALKTAKADGFPTVGVYDRHENRQNELKSHADYCIRDFADPVLKAI